MAQLINGVHGAALVASLPQLTDWRAAYFPCRPLKINSSATYIPRLLGHSEFQYLYPLFDTNNKLATVGFLGNKIALAQRGKRRTLQAIKNTCKGFVHHCYDAYSQSHNPLRLELID